MATAATPLAPADREPRRLTPTLRAVWYRESLLFRRYWLAIVFGSLIEPLIYMAGFGLGFGSIISSADGHPYTQFIGTGMVVTSVLFASAFAGMFETYNRRRHQRIYDAVLAQPADAWEVVTAEASWFSVKAAALGCAPLLVTVGLGLPVRPELLLVPPVTLIAAAGFGLFGIWVSTLVSAIDGLRLVVSGLLTPLVMAAGVFFPLNGLPGWVRAIADVNPIYHCTQLVRDCAFGTPHPADLAHLAVLLAFVALMGSLAVRGMNRRLID